MHQFYFIFITASETETKPTNRKFIPRFGLAEVESNQDRKTIIHTFKINLTPISWDRMQQNKT